MLIVTALSLSLPFTQPVALSLSESQCANAPAIMEREFAAELRKTTFEHQELMIELKGMPDVQKTMQDVHDKLLATMIQTHRKIMSDIDTACAKYKR